MNLKTTNFFGVGQILRAARIRSISEVTTTVRMAVGANNGVLVDPEFGWAASHRLV
jgi:hypothetical protein